MKPLILVIPAERLGLVCDALQQFCDNSGVEYLGEGRSAEKAKLDDQIAYLNRIIEEIDARFAVVADPSIGKITDEGHGNRRRY